MFSGALLGLTAIGLSTDAFAASVARSATSRNIRWHQAVGNGLVFGSIEGGMCLIGWSLAAFIAEPIGAVDHWIAVILLSIIGGRMFREALSQRTDDDSSRRTGGFTLTVLTAVGTSVDSAVVGVALHLADAPVWSTLLIGATSALMSTLGFLLGPLAGRLLGRRAEVAGGVLLIAIGLAIWIDHVWLQAA